MHVENGDLYKIYNEAQLQELQDMYGQAFKTVPSEFEEEALLELGDNEYTKVDMTKDSTLVHWARSEAKEVKKRDNKSKRKNKMIKESRKKNR